MDVSVRTTMKGAAKCDKHCELQNSVSRQELEHILCFGDIPKSMYASVTITYCCNKCHGRHYEHFLGFVILQIVLVLCRCSCEVCD